MIKKILPFLNMSTLNTLLLFTVVSCTASKHSLNAKYQKVTQPHVLSFFPSTWLGGAEVCCAIMHEYLYSLDQQSSILVLKNSPLSDYLSARQIPHYTAERSVIGQSSKQTNDMLMHQLRQICLEKKINIIQCHTLRDIDLVRQAIHKLPIKIALMYHGTQDIPFEQMKKISGVISTSPENVQLIKSFNKNHQLYIKKILHLFPFFDEEPLINYKQPQESAQTFFKKNYNISISAETPIICMIANFYQDADTQLQEPPFRKNHLLLIKALAKLIYERNKKAHIIFVGDGPTKSWHQDFCKKLNLENYVHFFGFCNDVRPILFHSTIHALTSREEPLGIVYLEASLMKKPSIGSSGTGAEHTIINEKTGFIFKNNDVDDLANKLEVLLDNKDLCTTLGLNAYKFITGKQHFTRKIQSPFINAQKMPTLIKFYRSLLQPQK